MAAHDVHCFGTEVCGNVRRGRGAYSSEQSGRKEQFGGAFIANEGFTFDQATTEVAAGRADAVAWGKEFIANPDLVERFRAGAARNPLVPETIYAEGARGYTDYPALG